MARGKNLPSSVSSTESGNSQSRNILTQTSYNQRFIFSKGVTQAGRLQYFWKLGETYEWPHHVEHSERVPDSLSVSVCSEIFSPLIPMTSQEKFWVDQEIEKMLKRGTIKVVQQECSIFLSSKQDSGHHPVINLKNGNIKFPTPISEWRGYSYWKRNYRKETTCLK